MDEEQTQEALDVPAEGQGPSDEVAEDEQELSIEVAHQDEPDEDGSSDASDADQVTSRIFTVANIVSIIRLCLIPAFVTLLFDGHNYLATFVFALAAGTDFIDGYLARSTHTVSRLGRLLDPAVDRLLMITGVVCLLVLERLPLWIIVVVVARDVLLLLGGAYLLARYRVRVPVVFAGKVATVLFFFGIGFLLLNWPVVNGLGVVELSWLPGFGAASAPLGIWFVYLGLVVALFTTIYYVSAGYMKAGVEKHRRQHERDEAAAQ